MSLRGQFFLSVVLALLVSLTALAAVALGHARASVGNEMAKALEASDRIVDNALLSLPQAGQELYLQRLVQSFDGNRHVRVALLEGATERTVSRLATADPVPGWYQRLLEMPAAVERLNAVLQLVTHRRDVLRLSQEIHARTQEQLDDRQRRVLLEEQMRAIRKELGDTGPGAQDVARLRAQPERPGLDLRRRLSDLKRTLVYKPLVLAANRGRRR